MRESVQETIWQRLPTPIVGLAPMSAVTDHAYRHIQKKYGNPALIFTEFTSAEGICAGATRLLRDFMYDESQRPIMAQVFGHTPDAFRQTAILLCELGFDGIDINMGCPAPKIADRGSGAALIRTPQLAQAIIRATQAGVRDWENGATVRDCKDISDEIADIVLERKRRLPVGYQERRAVAVSIKTRIGYDAPIVDRWLPTLLECEPDAVCLHGRTLAQMYLGAADWNEIARAVELRGDAPTLILGNGDIQSLGDVQRRVNQTGVDGVLLGRATFGNPFVFRADGKGAADFAWTARNSRLDGQGDHAQNRVDAPWFAGQRYSILNVLLEHCVRFEESFSHLPDYRFAGMRKHIGWYVGGLPGARRLKRTLLHASSVEDVMKVLHEYRAYRLRRDAGLQAALDNSP